MTALTARLALVALTMLAAATAASAAELPTQAKKAKPAETLKHCNVGGSPGVLAANGMCVKVSGYVSVEFGAERLR
jgi:hypothetical protein